MDIDKSEGDRSPTLVCDYSENDLNLLFLKSK